MKKLLLYFGTIAAIATMFAGCAKEVEDNTTSEGGRHYVEVSLTKAPETKTAVVEGTDGASYIWTEGDEARVHVYENGTAGEVTAASYSSDMKTATFTVAFTGEEAESYTYMAIYAKEVSNAKNPKAQVAQNPKTDNFDPDADLLVSKEINQDARATSLQFTMGRPVTVNKMTLTGLTAGEKVKTVEFSLNQGLDGYFVRENGAFGTGSIKKLTMSYGDEGIVVPTGGAFPVYFTVVPLDNATITEVKVTTDQNVYTKPASEFEGKTISFTLGKMKRFNMGMAGFGVPISTGTVYTLVSSQDNLVSGATYIIVASSANYALGLYTGGNNHPQVAIEKNTTNNTITIDNTLSVEPVIITGDVSNGYSIVNAAADNAYEGQYFKASSSANRLQEGTKGDSWSINIESGVASIISTTNIDRGYMYYNSSNNPPVFNCYADKSSDEKYILPALYVDLTTTIPDERADAEIAWSAEAGTAEITNEGTTTTVPTLSNPNELSVVYSSSDTDVATIDAETGELVILAEGETVIAASFSGNEDFKPASVAYTLTVTDSRVIYAFTSIAELYALDCSSTTGKEYTGTLTNAIVSFVPDTKNAIIKDETGSILFYKDGHGLLQGQTFTGEVDITVKTYNGLIEATAFSGSFTGSTSDVAPEIVTLAQIFGNYNTWQSAYVKLENVTVVEQEGKNITVKDGANTYVVYDNTATISVNANDVISAEGTITKFGSTEELKVWAADDLTVVSSAVATPEITCSSNTVTITCATEGATIYYTIDGTDPTTASAVYSEPFAITETVTVKAFAVKSGTADSGIASKSCTYTSADAPDPETIVFADLNLTNGTQYLDPFDGGHFTITFGGGANDGKYYDTGTGIRTYGGGTITIESAIEISAIKFTWSSGSYAPTSDVADPSGYNSGTSTWTGSAKSVVLTRPSGSGHWRLQSVTVTY